MTGKFRKDLEAITSKLGTNAAKFVTRNVLQGIDQYISEVVGLYVRRTVAQQARKGPADHGQTAGTARKGQ